MLYKTPSHNRNHNKCNVWACRIRCYVRSDHIKKSQCDIKSYTQENRSVKAWHGIRNHLEFHRYLKWKWNMIRMSILEGDDLTKWTVLFSFFPSFSSFPSFCSLTEMKTSCVIIITVKFHANQTPLNVVNMQGWMWKSVREREKREWVRECPSWNMN